MNRVVSRDGTPIAFDRTGTGPAIILVDGAFCSRSFGPTQKLARLLSQHFTVFAYDRRGRGDSGDTAPYAVAREVEDLAAIIEEAGGSAYVFGASSGAALALEAAAGGLNITKLALYEPPFVDDRSGRHTQADHRAQLERLVAADRRGDAVKYFMKDMVRAPALVVVMMRLMLPIWTKLKAVAHTLPYDAAVLGDWALPIARVASVRVPTLALDGEKSDPRLRRATRSVAETVPDAEYRSLKGQTHNVAANALAPALVEFFLRTPSRSETRGVLRAVRSAASG
jgi:pimeloyl-ACP methyl ester carboxylesterase